MQSLSYDVIDVISKEIDNLLNSHFINEKIVKIPTYNYDLSNFYEIVNRISIITSIIQKGDKKLLLCDNLFLYIYVKYEIIDCNYINLYIKIADNKEEFKKF
jgi:hypothetical protein